jgi:two-component system OmpR family response regulator
MRLLIIEDDLEVASYLVKSLQENGNNVEHAGDGRDGLFLASTEKYDAIVVDRMLPKIDGLDIVKSIRATGKLTPILVLSALGDVNDRVDGLRAGCDDYLTKPFAFAELAARLDAIVRRANQSSTDVTVLRVADLELNLLNRIASRSGKNIELQPREFRLLEYLMKHADQIVTRTMLLEQVWDYNFDPQTNVIDVHISRLRNKIDREFKQSLLHTVRGAGYMIREPLNEAE